MAGIDNFTVLMLHCNGTDTSTSFPDSSFSVHTVTANGNAQVDTAQFKFGGASALFDGSGDYLSIPDSPDFDFGTGDFTIDFWLRFAALPGGGSTFNFISRNTDVVISFFNSSGGLLLFSLSNTSIISASWAPSIDTWYHIAVTRAGTSNKLFVDGVTVGSASDGTDVNYSTNLTIGAENGAAFFLNGWIDELRFSKGIARWTADFTPPTSEYTTGVASNAFFSLFD